VAAATAPETEIRRGFSVCFDFYFPTRRDKILDTMFECEGWSRWAGGVNYRGANRPSMDVFSVLFMWNWKNTHRRDMIFTPIPQMDHVRLSIVYTVDTQRRCKGQHDMHDTQKGKLRRRG
jgi:hypothetical protein